MEKSLKIPTKDKHIIYGTLNYEKSNKGGLMIFVHGLPGDQNEHLPFNSSRFFPKNGIDTFRFDLYSWQKGGRQLKDCGFSDHIKDLETVVKFLSKTYKKIFLVGHSFGGLTIVHSDLSKVAKIVLWDPSSVEILSKYWNTQAYKNIDGKEYYIDDWGVNPLISKKMIEEVNNLHSTKKTAQKITIPTKIISAGKGVLRETNKLYAKWVKDKSQFTELKKASHGFDEEGQEEILFQETLKWILNY